MAYWRGAVASWGWGECRDNGMYSVTILLDVDVGVTDSHGKTAEGVSVGLPIRLTLYIETNIKKMKV